MLEHCTSNAGIMKSC